MRQLTSSEAGSYIDDAEIDFTHTIQQHTCIYVGRNAEGGQFVLLMDGYGHAIVTERK